jgi:fatty-acyl-CoA synthase
VARAVHVLVSPGFDAALMVDLVEHEQGERHRGGAHDADRHDRAARLRPARPVERHHRTVGRFDRAPELVRRIERELGVRFGIVYGQTEASPVITQTRLDDAIEDKAETVGQPLPQVEVNVIDPATGEIVPTGAVGELCARGYQVMTGYYEMPDKTAETIDADGWLHTGDLATMDERGYLRIVGRLRDMIIRGGENIYPREIEDVLFTHPGVARRPSSASPIRSGVRSWAPSSVRHRRRAHRAGSVRPRASPPRPHKTPTVWRFVDAYPLTPSGKIKKFELVEQYQLETTGSG